MFNSHPPRATVMMMRQIRLQGFLVGALLVSAASARDCSVCGDGYQVGSPSAITSVRFHEQLDTPYDCSGLELAGLEGLIPSDECSFLPSLIFVMCDCQESATSTQNRNDGTNSLHGAGSSSPRRVQTPFAYPVAATSPPVAAPISYVPPVGVPSFSGSSPPVVAPIFSISSPPVAGPIFSGSSPPVGAPIFRPSAFGPVATASAPPYLFSPVLTSTYYPISSNYYPAYFTPYNETPTEAPGNQSFIIVLSVVGCLGFIAFVAYNVAMNMSSQTNATPQRPPAIGLQIQATPTTLPMIPVPTPMQLKEQALARRPLVLAVLFPDEGKHEGDGEECISGRNLKYDEQSQRYIFAEDPTEASTCSICMECLALEDDTVTGLCSHIYHRECIMNWLQGGHDECPNCRQPMWDPETYKMVDQEIKDQNSGRPSAPLDDAIAVC